jgi:hypothetical protein
MAAERSEVPRTFEQVLKSEEKGKWLDACKEEMGAHTENGTFDIVDAPNGKKPVGSRWVFTIKDDGRYKARLVGQGYSQKFGLDNSETFSPVIRYHSVNVLVGVEARFGLSVHQMDLKTAFLNGQLEDEIYMKVAPGSKYEGTGKVYKLVKSIYRLKESQIIWHKTMDRALLLIWMLSLPRLYPYCKPYSIYS